jgi:hypothetical protein
LTRTEVTKTTEHTITKSVEQPHDGHQLASGVERVYFEWDKALSENDANAITKLYADDATVESPLIPHLLGKKEGICGVALRYIARCPMATYCQLLTRFDPASSQNWVAVKCWGRFRRTKLPLFYSFSQRSSVRVGNQIPTHRFMHCR